MKSNLAIAFSALALAAASGQLSASDLSRVQPSFIDYNATEAAPAGAPSSREAHVFPQPSYIDYATIEPEQASAGASAPVVLQPVLDASPQLSPEPSFHDAPVSDPARATRTL